MTIYYVSTTGSDNATGSASSPFRSINHAVNYSGLKPGDTVIVKDGTYTERVEMWKDGTASAYITLKAENPGGALIRPPAGTYSTLLMRADYNVVEGFDIVGGSGHAIDMENAHHLIARNNIAHDSGGSGISAYKSEYQTIEGNVTYGNAKTNGFHTSGISVCQNENLSGDTTTAGYRTIVRNNISHSNTETAAVGSEPTDGNGIIIDWNNQPWANSEGTQRYYKFPTLVDNNLVYNNGGKGIQVTWSDNVTVSNNTAYHNNQDNLNKGTWRGELSNQESSNNIWVNNIAVADPRVNPNNTAIGNYSPDSYVNQNVKWNNNITFNGTAGQASMHISTGDAVPTAANGNLLGVDPKFVKPGVDFNLLPDSPAINKGTSSQGLGTSDVDGGARVVNGMVDIGAQEFGSNTGTIPAPVPQPTSVP
jgi:serralysin